MIEGRSKLIFGTGDIMITPVVHREDVEDEKPDYGMLCLETCERREIGTFEGGNPDYSILGSEVLMVFNKVESADVMIERLQMLKKMMLGSKEDLLALSEVEVPEDFKVEEWK